MRAIFILYTTYYTTKLCINYFQHAMLGLYWTVVSPSKSPGCTLISAFSNIHVQSLQCNHYPVCGMLGVRVVRNRNVSGVVVIHWSEDKCFWSVFFMRVISFSLYKINQTLMMNESLHCNIYLERGLNIHKLCSVVSLRWNKVRTGKNLVYARKNFMMIFRGF